MPSPLTHCDVTTARTQVMEVHFAVAALRAQVVNINTTLAAPELAHVLCDSGAQLIIADVEFAGQLAHAFELAEQQHPTVAPATPAAASASPAAAAIPAVSDTPAASAAPDTTPSPPTKPLCVKTIVWLDMARLAPHDVTTPLPCEADMAEPGEAPPSLPGVASLWYTGGQAKA